MSNVEKEKSTSDVIDQLGVDVEEADDVKTIDELDEEERDSIMEEKDIPEEEVEEFKEAKQKEMGTEEKSEGTRQSFGGDWEFTLSCSELPSKGMVYSFDTVKAKQIPVKDQKGLDMINNVQNIKMYNQHLRKAVQNSIMQDLNDFLYGDQMGIFLFLRHYTWHSEYKFNFECPQCGAEIPKYTINLQDLDINYLPEDYEEPLVFELEGREFHFSALRIRDEARIETFIDDNAGQYNMSRNELFNTARHALWIDKATDCANSLSQKVDFIQNEVTTKQYALIRAVADRYAHGVEMTKEEECPSCDRKSTIQLPFTPEIYYPSGESIVDLEDARK